MTNKKFATDMENAAMDAAIEASVERPSDVAPPVARNIEELSQDIYLLTTRVEAVEKTLEKLTGKYFRNL